MNLLKADFYHLIKNKVFYVLLSLTFFMPILTCVMFPEMTVEKIIFQGLDVTLLCSIIGIMLALFVGKDYDNNTIRNKVCYGEKRSKIMAVTFIEGAIICLIFIAVSVLSSFVFGSIICKFAFTADFAAKFFCQIFILLAFFHCRYCNHHLHEEHENWSHYSAHDFDHPLRDSADAAHACGDQRIAFFLCRIIYATVSSNLLNSTGGTFIYASYAQSGAASVTFGHLYLNAIILSVVYILIAVGVTAVVVRKQSYK